MSGWKPAPPVSGGSGGAIDVVSAGSLGTAYTLALASRKNVLLVGTLNANVAITITGLTAGAQVRFHLTQDGTGGRTVTLGGTALPAGLVDTTATESSTFDAYSPDGVEIVVLGQGGDALTIADVTGLQAALDAKTATGHKHVMADITDLTSGSSAVDRAALWAPTNAKAWTFDRASARSDSLSPLTSQRLYVAGGMVLVKDVSYSSLSVLTSASGGNPSGISNIWFCLVDPATNKVVAVTVNNGSTAWAASTLKTLSIDGGPFVPTTTKGYYLGVMVHASTIGGYPSVNQQTAALAPVLVANTALTGLTTPIAVGTDVGTLTAGTSLIYGLAS